MKLINEKLAGEKIKSHIGELSVDEHGVVDCEDKDLCHALMNSGFKEFKGKDYLF